MARIQRAVNSHWRRSAVEVANVLFNRPSVLKAIGFINRRLNLIKGVFLVYPASPDYAAAYAYPARIEKQRWSPWPTGILWQNRRLTLMVAVSATDADFLDASDEDLAALEQRVEAVRKMVGADQKAFAGILPGVMTQRGVLRDPPERELTSRLVRDAIRRLAPADACVVVLGGRGFIGRRLVELLEAEFHVHVVDLNDPWPDSLGHEALVVNVANRRALQQHLNHLQAGMSVLNEVYPEPRGELLATLNSRGVAVHHVVGVRAGAFPPFPAGYRGAVPCCAAWAAEDATVVVRRLSAETLNEPVPTNSPAPTNPLAHQDASP